MGRKSIKYKNKIVSISLLPTQKFFLDTHPSFNLSKYVQIQLQQLIELFEELEIIDYNGGVKK